LDWAGNYAHLLGVNDDPQFLDVTRLYLMLHADHEGGNVSSHVTHTVGSALSDPYYSWAAGVCGLAGPLHGLANQECLRWLEQTAVDLKGQEPTVEVITKYAQDTLASGRVIPGFGHAVLRQTDPRYTLEHEFASKYLKDDPTFKLADMCLQAIPPVLQATGKVKNPWPNVDALSGTVMKYYGLKEADYYTVVFAVSRALGVTAQMVWSRVLGAPIERPNSVTLEWLEKKIQ
jgi:citrate synthase